MKTEPIEFGPHRFNIALTKSGWEGVIIRKNIQKLTAPKRYAAPTRDALLEKLQKAVLADTADFVGYDGAVKRFTTLFPGGFENADFLHREVKPKHAASKFVREALPADGSGNWKTCKDDVIRAFQMTELLHPIEKAKLKDMVLGPDGETYFDAVRQFHDGEYAKAGSRLTSRFKSTDIANWRALTYLPFLWSPKQHMFLRPTFLREFASAVGHRFTIDYRSDLDPAVYRSLLALLSETRTKLADEAGIDNIVLQSFIWVAVQYKDSDVAAP